MDICLTSIILVGLAALFYWLGHKSIGDDSMLYLDIALWIFRILGIIVVLIWISALLSCQWYLAFQAYILGNFILTIMLGLFFQAGRICENIVKFLHGTTHDRLRTILWATVLTILMPAIQRLSWD